MESVRCLFYHERTIPLYSREIKSARPGFELGSATKLGTPILLQPDFPAAHSLVHKIRAADSFVSLILTAKTFLFLRRRANH
jgi:hypothetical protein